MIAAGIVVGQLLYVPVRGRFVAETTRLVRMPWGDRAREAALPADLDLLLWVVRVTRPEDRILLVTGGEVAPGDPDAVLYHRALYLLYPRTVWWARPVASERYPRWWTVSDPAGTDLAALARRVGANAVLAVGPQPVPLSGRALVYGPDIRLIRLRASP